MSNFGYLLRFKNPSGQVWYGEATANSVAESSFVGSSVQVYKGSAPWDLDFQLVDHHETVSEVHELISCSMSVSLNTRLTDLCRFYARFHQHLFSSVLA
jgi:hypothetical protein